MLAPFVLENLNCTGTEAMLVDCPVATDISDTTIQFNSAGPQEYFYMRNFDMTSCDFFDGTFPFVACGSVSGQGAHR